MTVPAPQSTPVRLAASLTALAAVNTLLLSVGPYAWIYLLLAPPVGVAVALIVLAALVVLDALILRWARGRSSILASLVTVGLGVVLTAGLFMVAGPDQGWWTFPSPIPLVAGVVSALVAAIFLPGRWPRAIGVVALVVAVAVLVVPNSIAAAQRQEGLDAVADAAAAAALEQRVAASTLPFIAELPGSSVWDVQPGDYVSIAYIVTADGGALRIDTVGESADTGRDALGCWMLVGDLGVFDDSVTMDHYAGVCDEVADGRWQEADGSGIAVVQQGVLVLLTAVDPESAEAVGGTRPATTAELADAVDQLRLISRDELRDYLLSSPVDPDGLGG